MKSNKEIIESEIPARAFFTFRQLGDLGPFSGEYWSKRVREGAVRVVQRNAKRQGSRILVPRSEVVRHLAECVR